MPQMFKNNLLSLRKNADLSQDFMAKNLSMSRATYIKLEKGLRSPTLKELEKIATILEVDLETLISKTEASLVDSSLIDEMQKIPQLNKVKVDGAEIKLDETKLTSVLLYVLEKVGSRSNIGETVLYKLFYFIDFDYYEKFSQSITGLKYRHNYYGPTPSNSFRVLIKEMVQNKELQIVETVFHDRVQKKYLATVAPDLEVLNGQEIEHINEVLGRLGHKTAAEITDYAHQDTPWLVTEQGEEIDYRLSKYRTATTSVVYEEDEL